MSSRGWRYVALFVLYFFCGVMWTLVTMVLVAGCGEAP